MMKQKVPAAAAVILALTSGIGAKEPGTGEFAGTAWKPVFQGVEHAAVSLLEPRPLRAQVLRVTMGTPGLSVLATLDNGEAPGETTGQKTTSFLKAMKCQAAVNAGPFDKVTSFEGGPLDVSGLHVAGGKQVSKYNGYPVLFIDADNKARIQRKPELAGIREAVSGFQVVLWEGKTTATDLKLHPRTGAGVSADGRTMWLLVVDGRQAGRSEGCTTVEMAAWLRAMGANSALNLDGGGTTTMVLAGPEGKPLTANVPIHAGIPGMERPAGSHLGIRARALAGPAAGK